jgi:hypothetical protein
MKDTIYGAHSMFTAAVTPPVLTAIFLGITWRRYTPMAAFATIVGGAILIALSFVWPDTLVGPLDFGMGPDSYKFMRALYGLLVAGSLGILVTWISRPRPESELKGLIAGTQTDAMRQFKGGEPNRKPGRKVRVRVKLDKSLTGTETALLSQSSLDTMAAESGDLLYASHTRWWYGGLRSVHVKAGPVALTEDNTLLIGPDSAATARFVDGQEVIVEKIM